MKKNIILIATLTLFTPTSSSLCYSHRAHYANNDTAMIKSLKVLIFGLEALGIYLLTRDIYRRLTHDPKVKKLKKTEYLASLPILHTPLHLSNKHPQSFDAAYDISTKGMFLIMYMLIADLLIAAYQECSESDIDNQPQVGA